MLAGKIVPVSLGTVPVMLGQGNDSARFAGWEQLLEPADNFCYLRLNLALTADNAPFHAQ